MSERPVRLADLSETQLGALLMAFRGPLRWDGRMWRRGDEPVGITRRTFTAMVALGLFRTRSVAEAVGGSRRSVRGDLTLAGYALADVAISVSREIAAAIAGRKAPAFLPDADLSIRTEADIGQIDPLPCSQPVTRMPRGYRRTREAV